MSTEWLNHRLPHLRTDSLPEGKATDKHQLRRMFIRGPNSHRNLSSQIVELSGFELVFGATSFREKASVKSFEAGFLEKQRIPQNLLRTIRLLGEYKGKKNVFKQQSPQVLETLRQAAMIQSTESSNRIEGVVAPHDRIVKIVQKKLKPANRSEQEIAGYRDVLNTIHANHADMKFSVNLVLQMHRDLLKFTPRREDDGKQVKMKSNKSIRMERSSSALHQSRRI